MRSGKFELAWFQKFKESKADAVHARTDRGVGVLIFLCEHRNMHWRTVVTIRGKADVQPRIDAYATASS